MQVSSSSTPGIGMTSPLYIAQQIFSAYTASTNGISDLCTNGTASNITRTLQSSSPVLPTDVSSLLSFFLSLSALREWLKLFTLGSVLESLRRLALFTYKKIYSSFFVTAQFECGDTSYYWMMVWLSKRPEWKSARDVEVSSEAVENYGTPDAGDDALHEHVRFIPAESTSLSISAHGSWIRATRTFRETRYGNRLETLELSIFSLRRDILYIILKEAKKSYEAALDNNISIYNSTSRNTWRLVASRPKRPLTSIVLEPGIKSLLIDDARDFLESKSWYAARGIPFRRGYLLHGAPGSGKTSIIQSLAGELELDVYILSLSRSLLDDTALAELVSKLPEKCIALMEDIDAAFDQNINRGDLDQETNPYATNGNQTNNPQQPSAAPTSHVTLSGLLNALDGVGAQEGRILFATTNRYSSLDPALIRPGRMDIHVQFKLASKYQARELYRCFYHPEAEAKEREASAVLENAKESKVCSEKETESGHTSADEKSKIISSPTSEDSSINKSLAPDEVPLSGASHRPRAPKLTSAQVAALSEKFAEAIPQREFSMAALQGYLMTYKIRPYEAVNNAPAWVEKERAAMAAKELKATPTSTTSASTAGLTSSSATQAVE